MVAQAAAAFFREPRVESIVYWLALANFIRAWENIGVVDFRKRLEFAREFRYLLSARVLGTIATLSFALAWHEYWALVAGTLAHAIIKVALSFVLSRYRPRFANPAFGEIFHFSKWMQLQNVLAGLNERAASLTLGRLSGADALAHYSVANELANLATTELAAPVRRAVLPGFAQVGHDRAELRNLFLRTFALMVFIALPIPVGIAIVAPRIVDVLLGPNWTSAVPLIKILAVSGVLRALSTSSHVVYLALGKPGITALLSGIRLVVIVPTLVWLALVAGAIGAAWATVAVAGFMWVLDVVILVRVLDLRVAALTRTTWRPVVAVGVMAVLVHNVDALLGAGGSVLAGALQLAVIVLLGAVIYGVASLGLWRACLRPEGAEAMILRTLRRARAVP
jgi:O-antigen/teichoic acid export membrane protein